MSTIKVGDTVVVTKGFSNIETNESTTIVGKVIEVKPIGLILEVDINKYGTYNGDKYFYLEQRFVDEEHVTVLKAAPKSILVNKVKEVTITEEVYVSEYNETTIDKWYNKYCKMLKRDRIKKFTATREVDVKEYKTPKSK